MAIVDIPALSYGFLHSQVTPEYRYGLVHRARFPGLQMDVGHLRRVAFEKTNQTDGWLNYNRLRGQQASALEHAIPERFFDDPTDGNVVEGISAVKAIAVAAQQGQKIYRIAQANQGQLANVQQSTSVIENARNAIAAGKEVVIHERPINHGGFTGAGYMVLDPQTGGGSYLIEGGANGGGIIIIAAIVFIAAIFASALAGNFFATFLITVNYIATMTKISEIAKDRSLSNEQVKEQVESLLFLAGVAAFLTFVAPYAAGAGAETLAAIAFGAGIVLMFRLYFFPP